MIDQGTIWLWGAIGLVGFMLGIAVGFVAASALGGREKKLRALEDELEQTKSAYGDYRDEVHEHFGKTAELFEAMTGQYRSVYEHLARGAHALGSGQWQTPLLHLQGMETPEGPPAQPEHVPDATPAAATSAETQEETEALGEAPNPADLELMRESGKQPSSRELH